MFGKWLELEDNIFVFVVENAMYHASYEIKYPWEVKYDDEVQMYISVVRYVFNDDPLINCWQWGNQVISKTFHLYAPRWEKSRHDPNWDKHGFAFWNSIVSNDPSFLLALIEKSEEKEEA